MNLKPSIISVDIGTTNLKATYLNDRTIIDTVDYTYVHHRIDSQHYQMSWQELLSAFDSLIQQLVERYQLQSFDIILTCAMHSVILVDTQLQPLSDIYTWADRTGADVLAAIPKEQQAATYLLTGTPAHIMNPYYKLQSLLGHQFKGKVASIKDLLLYHLTNQWMIDVSCAASSGLMNYQTLSWETSLLQTIGLTENQLPTIVQGREAFPCKRYQDCHVFAGFSDGVSSNGAYSVLENTAVLSLGTSHAVRVLTRAVQLDTIIQNFAYSVDETQYIVGLPSNNAGNVLEWIRQKYQLNWLAITELIQQRPSISHIFLPYVYGERAPIWQDGAQEQLIPLVEQWTTEQEVFSMIIGVLFNIKVNVRNLQSLVSFDQIALTGGLTQNIALCQLLADVLQLPLLVVQQPNIETIGSMQLIEYVADTLDFQTYIPNNANVFAKDFQRFVKALDNYQLRLNGN
ncbi:hypothetical protein IU403_00870 [Aerococcaceae bacterium zg-BR22]|uniref:FGGY family carbohydrate kinase n=1 Tax=Aerococcaceae bacterium zg-1292 TaxID=2774330 RepID=UPI004063661F|nr:hypothetical protein [Aerococcaceae bacterium zg-BR22]